jgi:spore cortex biosynthesis protein YabQ
VQDIVFWLAATVSFFVFLHTYSGGVRPFAVVGAVCGAALYFATASPFVVRFFVWLIQLLIAPFTAAFRFLHRLVRKPLRIAARYATIHKKRLAQQLHILRRKV